jgi:hypothetical protein
MAEKGVGEVRASFASQGEPGHCHLRPKLGTDKRKQRLGPIQSLRHFGVARKSDHEVPVYQVDVVLPSGPETLHLLKIQVRELLMHHEANEYFAQLAITGRWLKQDVHSSWPVTAAKRSG